MVQAYSNNITVNAKSAVPFNNVVFSKGCTTDLQNATFTFNKAGIYMVAVDASVEPSAAGEIELCLYQNGQPLPYAAAQATGAVDSTTALAFTTLIRCPQDNNRCNCLTAPTTIQLWDDSDTIDLTGGFNIVVTKLC